MIRLAVLAVSAAVLATGCKKDVPLCPAAYAELPESFRGAGGECACPMGIGSGSVWGGGVYTQDSNLCRAAVHAGAVDPEKGGAVKFKPAPGCSRYSGSSRHGVVTAKWNEYPQSFYFPGFGEPACPSRLPNECPDTYAAIPNAQGLSTFSCTCDAVAAEGSVWGSGIYTRDSALCRAALHAGATGAAGGKVTVRPAAGCPKYLGSVSHGVGSSAWGAYEGSFYFEDYGSPACPDVPADLCPATFLAIPGADEVKTFSCTCGGDPLGAVWGTGIYTRDSSLCGAAVHAGVLAKGLGKITVRAALGCASYEGSPRNGVTTHDWESYEGSFVLEGTGDQRCAQ